MKKWIIALVILALIAGAVFWFFYPLRSYICMRIYSAQQKSKSVMKHGGFAIDMPSGEGWYPFVMTYNAPGFDDWSGIDAQMTIMYNFGAFDIGKRTSAIYDTDSDKYSSFYGAYAVRQENGVFGFDNKGEIDMDAVTLAVEYDYTQLVIKDFGCDAPVFRVDDYSVTKDVHYAGSGEWTRVDAVLTANGAAHNFKRHIRPYLQYGRPMDRVESDFEVISLYGRVYAKHIDEYKCTVMIYVIAPNRSAVDACDDAILSKTVIKPE